ncbi:ABC transporter substrate-binding protein [Rhizobium sp. LC145]|uniref:ABC transporter substrate-binding protein n=1 Tax=Rhizobium sp. LC145 TaxID=1120688 RepID=UPI00062A0FE0|nr:ABC transporter substrate-binding protein [Rhizobium sp. LC145]KKX32920.1 nitrate ABC transporter substrate-binding protein [Rhizobium sp. LC145]TKT57333.1 ABC transporter substrate-binding protein [Rhizobiaceae bacterium LC148]
MSDLSINRRGFMKTAAAIGGLAAAQTLLSVRPGSAGEPAKIRMQLGWLASNGLLGEIVAIKKGYYSEHGLDLEIVPGGPNVDGVAGVAAGQASIGQISSSPSVMLARGAGVPIKAIAVGYQQHPYAYFSRKAKPVRSAQDMIGKTLAIQPTGAVLLRALLTKNGVPEDQVNVVNMGADMNQLVTGQADVVVGWITNTNALKVLGDDRIDLMLWDAGIQLYANVYYTTDQELADHSEELAGFISATAKGWGYARDNQSEAVDLLIDAYPNLDKTSELETIGPLMKFAFNETTKVDGWGTMTEENWAAQIKTYADLDQFKETVPTVEDVMTLSILEATADIRKQVG